MTATRRVASIRRLAAAYPTVLVLLVLGPLYGYSLMTVGGRAVGRPDILASVLIILVSAIGVVRRGQLLIDPAGQYFLGFAAISSVSMLLAVLIRGRPPLNMLTLYLQVVMMAMLYVGAINLQLKLSEWIQVGRLWVFSAVGIALFGLYQGVARLYSLPLARLTFNGGAGSLQRIGYGPLYHPTLRVASVFLEPSWYGTYLVPPALLCLAGVLVSDQPTLFGKRTEAVFGGVFVIAILQSASLLSYLTLGAGVAFLLLVSLVRDGLRPVHGAVVLTGVAMLPLLIISASLRSLTVQLLSLPLQFTLWLATGDIGHVTAASAQVRLEAVLATVRLWATGPAYQLFVGQGPNSLEGVSSVTFDASSGSYFQILLDQGAFGLAIFLGGLATLVVESRSLDQRGDRFGEYLSIAVPAVLVATGVMLLQIGYLRPIRWFPMLFAGGLLSTGVFAEGAD